MSAPARWLEKVNGRPSAVAVAFWGVLNLAWLSILIAFGGDSLENASAAAAVFIVGCFALLLFTGRRRGVGTTVVQPLAASGWSAFFLAVALVLLGMAFPFGVWTAVVAPVPLFAAAYLYLASRQGTRPTLSAAEASAVRHSAAGDDAMTEDDRKAAYLAAEEAGVEGLSPVVAQAMLTRPAPPPSFAETERAAAVASGAQAAEAELARRRTRQARLVRVGRAVTAGAATALLLRRRRKSRRSWE